MSIYISLPPSSIIHCCNHRTNYNTAYGYKWKWKYDL